MNYRIFKIDMQSVYVMFYSTMVALFGQTWTVL